ncbi:MAG: A/G-specific adenine glycosylase [Chloroflexota bacterium]|jgi:A/G-specific adenine glycosylase|nr:A/G-specific adenine glycosylase [Chloroflexota bacterium]
MAATPPSESAPTPATTEDRALQTALLAWYDVHRRDLPWRHELTPYRVLISEIMLQQTQVDRVIPYFERFTERFPDFATLAVAPRADVIRLWAGLGYNRRAVQLHELARTVMETHAGELPADRAALLALPGIGPYTAGAILSIAFGQDEPALDTNVRRVIGRVAFAAPLGPAALSAAASRLVPVGHAADWNQALMDLGSAICLSRRPRCLICPLQAHCRSAGATFEPVRREGRPPAEPFTQSNRYFRGQLLGELRALPPGVVAPLPEIAAHLMARGVAEPKAGWQVVGAELARDGLAVLDEGATGVALGLA